MKCRRIEGIGSLYKIICNQLCKFLLKKQSWKCTVYGHVVLPVEGGLKKRKMLNPYHIRFKELWRSVLEALQLCVFTWSSWFGGTFDVRLNSLFDFKSSIKSQIATCTCTCKQNQALKITGQRHGCILPRNNCATHIITSNLLWRGPGRFFITWVMGRVERR